MNPKMFWVACYSNIIYPLLIIGVSELGESQETEEQTAIGKIFIK